MNLSQKYGKLIFFFRKNKVYLTLNEAKCVYMPCITVRELTCQKLFYFEESRGGKGNYCLQVGERKSK
jgi:hypothetical protein